MMIPLPERERLIDQVTEDLVAAFPLAREHVRARVAKCVHDSETLHEFFRSKNGRRGKHREYRGRRDVG